VTDMVSLDEVELAAWRGLLRVHSDLTRELDRELREAERLTLTEYDVLVQLADAPGGRLRMSELADAVLLSRSGLTRLVDDLVRRGLVLRERCPDDARGLEASLTAEGAALREKARATHLAGVRRRFVDRLSDRQLRELARAFEGVAGES